MLSIKLDYLRTGYPMYVKGDRVIPSGRRKRGKVEVIKIFGNARFATKFYFIVS